MKYERMEKKVKIRDFLTEREGRYKPDDSKISKYKRLDKIDFSGTIHISDKPTKTDMIIVHPGDLVISGINVAKGAVAVYQGDDPVCATIHYSSYTFDSSKVDLEYFKYFVKSPAFIAALQKQVKGGIKTEIKPKHLLPLEISIPELQTQQEIVKKISLQLKKTEQLYVEIESQKNYIKQLRQNILQDAIEGKLTVDWRRQNPVQKGNPDYDAEALFEQIQKERINEKKHKGLSLITEKEKPFEIPDGWKWVRLGEIIKEPPRNGYSPKAVDFETSIKTLKLGAVTYGVFDPNEYKYINEEIPKDAYCWLQNGDFLIERSNSIEYVGICAIYTGKDNEFMYPDLLMRFRTQDVLSKQYIHTALISPFNRSYFMSKAKGAQKTMPKINQECVVNTMIPLPPIAEQKEIVIRVEKHLQAISNLDNQIIEREQLTKRLMQSILKDAFEEN
jgi:type I restriction enzyme S subunit